VSVHQGDYLISEFINISQNLKLNAEGNVTVRFNFSERFDATNTNEPHYVLSFINIDRVELNGFDFTESPGIITMVSVNTIVIQDCSFRHFFQGALDLYNCGFIRVTDSVFEHNGPTSIIKQDQYRGHAGGLSIGYNNISVSFGPVAYVSGCVFRNNTSDPTSDLVQTTSQLVQFSRFTGRGGGCAIPINPLYSLNATVENCLFEQNYAGSFGGGLYINFNGLEHHIVTIRQVQFLRNQAPTAGGLEVAFVSGGNTGADNRLEVYDSNFTENIATFGGGVNIFTLGADVDSEGTLGNFASFENCTFLRNTAAEFGAAIGVSTLLYFREISNITPFQITSCNFLLNDAGGGGAIGVAYFPLAFNGDTVFQQNRGRTLVVSTPSVIY
jgi:predicted outer membrane repeat protein